MNTEAEHVYTLASFGREISSEVKKRIEGKSNIIKSCILFGVMLLLIIFNCLVYRIIGGIICGVVITLTFYSLISDLMKGIAFGDMGSSGKAYLTAAFGKSTSGKERILIILSTTAIPLAIALLMGNWNDSGIALGLCILISSRSERSLCLRVADGAGGSLTKKNFNRKEARKYMAGFGAGLLIFSLVISAVNAVGAFYNDAPVLQAADEYVDFNITTRTGTIGQLHNSIVAFNDSSEKYNVIVETVSCDEDMGLYYRTYALWDSKDVNEFNFEQYMVYSGATAKLIVSSTDFSFDTGVSGLTLYLPWYGIHGMSSEGDENKQLANFARCVVAGIMPDLTQKELDDICKKLHLTKADFDYMAENPTLFSKSEGLYIARFGPDNMNYISASYNSYHGKYELLFDNLALSVGITE